MPCVSEFKDVCPKYKKYAGAAGPLYHGELCEGCGLWRDTQADIAFKREAGKPGDTPYTGWKLRRP